MFKKVLYVILAITLFIGMYSIAHEEKLNQLDKDARVEPNAVASAGSNAASATASIGVLVPSEVSQTTKFEGTGAAIAGVVIYFGPDDIDRDPPGENTGGSIWIRVNVVRGPGTIARTEPNGPTQTETTQNQSGGSIDVQDPTNTIGGGITETSTQTEGTTYNPGTTTTTVKPPEVILRTFDHSKRHAEVSGSHRHAKASASRAKYKTLSDSDCATYLPDWYIFTPIGFLIDSIFN